jgi:predicted ATPase/DNA-binding CsgD family transcriptional regulator
MDITQRFVQLGASNLGSPAHPFYSIGPLIGRAAELDALRAQVLDPAVRMVALTGPVGVGKSRLAAALFKQVCGELGDGGCFVDFGQTKEGEDLAERLAEALACPDDSESPPLTRLGEWLGDREVLLVIDHCEDLLDEVGMVMGPLLADCSGLRMLVACQESPRMYGGCLFRLAPLRVPGHKSTAAPEELERIPSIELFLHRTRVVRPGFALTEDNREAVAELCRHLDGLPLAIELAASRLKLLTSGALLTELDHGLDCLYGGRADTLSRELSMPSAIARGCERLSEDERSSFFRLAVFTGEFGITAADAVVRPTDGTVHKLLETLVDKNLLIQQDQVSGELGFSMLGTVRAYALGMLSRTKELERVERSHAAYFLTRAQTAERELAGPYHARWLEQLTQWDRELENAFTFFLSHGDGSEAAALAAALRSYWLASGRLREGDRRLAQSLAVGGLTRECEAKALEAAGELGAWLQVDRAEGHLVQAREIYEDLHDHRGAAACLHHLGTVAYLRGDLTRAAGLLQEATVARRAAGDVHGHARAVRDLAALHRDTGDLAEARSLAEAALRMFRGFEDTREAAITCDVLAQVAADEGDLQRAGELVGKALGALDDGRDAIVVARCLETSAGLLSKRGRERERWRRCTGLLSIARALRNQTGCAPAVHLRPALDDLIERARVRLGGAAFGHAWTEGSALSVDDAIATALDPVPQESPALRRLDVDLATPLTPREHEVAELVAHGLTNREIARRLGIAEWTAVNHLRKVMRKLNCSSRVHVANWVAHRQTAEGVVSAMPAHPRLGRQPAARVRNVAG